MADGPADAAEERAFLVAKGRVAHEETTGTKVWIDQVVTVSSVGAHMRALATAVLPTLRAARHLQPPAAKPARPVTRQDVDRVTRLYETGDAAHLVLQFGEYKDCTLFQVAQTDPDYVRRLAR